MGICRSSNNKNQEMLNNSGSGLPPQEIIPQAVEVTNITEDLNNQVTSQPEPVSNLDSANQQLNSINPTPANLTNKQSSQLLNNSNQNLNTSGNLNHNDSNLNLPLNANNDNTRINSSLQLNQNGNINNSINLNNSNLKLGNTMNSTQLITDNPNTLGNSKFISNSQGPNIINNTQMNNALQNANNSQTQKLRMYIVVQLPQREIEITKLYHYNCLLDIEPFIAPDSINEYDFYNSRGYSIDDYLYTPFYEWHNIYKTLRIIL